MNKFNNKKLFNKKKLNNGKKIFMKNCKIKRDKGKNWKQN